MDVIRECVEMTEEEGREWAVNMKRRFWFNNMQITIRILKQ